MEGDWTNEGVVENKDRGAFYQDAAQYWSQIPATVDGMLGGYGFISKVDIQGSNLFLKQLFRLKVPPGKGRALDCGAGIGRITKNLLFNHFQKVDLVEQDPAFVNQAHASLESHSKMGEFFCSGLQDFIPESAAYDVIWCQWVLSHLKDDDLIAFLHGCIRGLKENGVIVVKENTTTSGKKDEDPTDSSVTRPLNLLCGLLQQAGLRCVKQKRQENFPHGLYPVYMIATRPISNEVEQEKRTHDIAVSQEPLEVAICGSIQITSKEGVDTSLNRVEHRESEVLVPMEIGADVKQIKVPDAVVENYFEPFEEEATAYDCQVEYSSDDSTKTEISPSESNSSQTNLEQSSQQLLKVNSPKIISNAENESDLKCDIV